MTNQNEEAFYLKKVLPSFKVETVKTHERNEISICPERGGIITSLKIGDRELLYMEEETFLDQQKNVRGGIPVLFPNAGPNDNPEFPEIKQHGFARTSEWKSEKIIENEFSETLMSDDISKEIYPYDFKLNMAGKIENNGSFTIVQSITNLEKEKSMPISMGLHPYFRVPNTEKKNIKFDFEGGKTIEDNADKWMNGKSVSIDNPKLKNPEAKIKVSIPGLGILILDISSEFQKIWIWSLPDKDFVCIEPVMRDSGGFTTDPELVEAGKSISGMVNINIEK